MPNSSSKRPRDTDSRRSRRVNRSRERDENSYGTQDTPQRPRTYEAPDPPTAAFNSMNLDTSDSRSHYTMTSPLSSPETNRQSTYTQAPQPTSYITSYQQTDRSAYTAPAYSGSGQPASYSYSQWLPAVEEGYSSISANSSPAIQSYAGTPTHAQTDSYPQQSYDTPKPDSAILQCCCLGCDSDSKWVPKLGEEIQEPKKSTSSSRRERPHSSASSASTGSRSKHSSKRIDNSKSTASSWSASTGFDDVKLASLNTNTGAANCGSLYLSRTEPCGRPREPDNSSDEDLQRYKVLLDKWLEDSKEWRDISCLCGYGYFSDLDGHWVPGNYVRKYMKEGRDAWGAEPPNPRWASNGGQAPQAHTR